MPRPGNAKYWKCNCCRDVIIWRLYIVYGYALLGGNYLKYDLKIPQKSKNQFFINFLSNFVIISREAITKTSIQYLTPNTNADTNVNVN